MRSRPDATTDSIRRGLDIAFAASALLAAVGPVIALHAGSPWQACASVALLAAIVALWRVRRSREVRATPAFMVAVVAMGLLADVGPTPALLLFLAAVVVGVDLGFVAGVAAAVFAALLYGTSAAYAFHPPIEDVVVENGALGLFLLLVAGFGSMLRATELARSRTAAIGADLTRANLELRRSLSLERELVLAEERARSARELHDGLGHRLTLVAMSLEYAQRAGTRDSERAWAEVATAAGTTRQALADMRLWVRALDPPPAPEGVGGAAAFEAIAAAFRGTGLEVRVAHRGDQRVLERDASLFATRFIQEGLTNVLRHADAGRVDIEVLQSPQQVRLSIGDDGKGGPPVSEGFGRRALRERAEVLGGQVGAGRSSLGGFELFAILPLEPAV